MYHMLIVGAGYTGCAVTEHFRRKNQRVWAVARSAKYKERIECSGAVPVIADLTKPETLDALPQAHFIIICAAPDNRDAESYRKIYLEGIGNLLKARQKQPPPFLILYLSSTGVYGTAMEGWLDESSAPQPNTERAKILLQAEELVLHSGFPSAVFRLSGIYGPGRNRIVPLREGRWPEPGDDRYLNMIHLEDIVHAIPVLLNKAETGQIYLGVDDEPVLQSELCKWLAPHLGLRDFDKHLHLKTSARPKRYRNNKLKSLGYSFRFPTFREGYQSFLTETHG
ncbi:MAG: SDR family oxidoreductase [Candidatus Omnitrophota bacterium]|nr:SDR family oxidoreductase [Candidatus Omnitrophota bacterium]